MNAKQEEIKKMKERIRARQKGASRDLATLQQECEHPNVVKTYGGSHGNYDPTNDGYWAIYDCPDCDKHWTEDLGR